MKFILSMIICTSVYNTCLSPHPMPDLYGSYYNCIIAGYEESLRKAKEIGAPEINKYGIVIKFYCLPLEQHEKKIDIKVDTW